MAQEVDVVIVAAGKGARLGSRNPKAFVPLGGRPMLLHSLEQFARHPAVHRIVAVVPEDKMNQAGALLATTGPGVEVLLLPGGDQRWQSVQNGVADCASEWVLVHDAARPFVTRKVIDALLAKRQTYRCAITATPEVDTIRTFEEDRCTGTIDRSTLVRVGTPQLFHRETLLEAFLDAPEHEAPPTDEAMLMEQRGIPVGFAWGDPLNFKITTPEDLTIAEAIVAARAR